MRRQRTTGRHAVASAGPGRHHNLRAARETRGGKGCGESLLQLRQRGVVGVRGQQVRLVEHDDQLRGGQLADNETLCSLRLDAYAACEPWRVTLGVTQRSAKQRRVRVAGACSG